MSSDSPDRLAPNTAVAPTALSWEEAVALLQGQDLAQRYYAAWYLGTTQDPRSVEPLLQALRDEADRTALGGYPLRRNAARALGVIGDRRAAPGLIEALDTSDPYLQEEIAYALAQLGDPAAVPPLLALLHDPTADRPWEAIIEALGQLRATQATEVLQPFRDHPSERVRSATAWTLYRLTQDPALTQVLLDLLGREDSILRQAALFDLAESGWLGGAEAIAGCDVAVNLRLNALKRLFDVALVPDAQAEHRQQIAATTVMPWIERLL